MEQEPLQEVPYFPDEVTMPKASINFASGDSGGVLTCFCDQIGCELGSNGLSALCLPVGAGIAIVRDDSCD